MAATEIKVRMQQRRDTAAGWASANPTLLNGELGFETDTYKYKLGNGSTAWNSLAYASSDPDKLVEGNTEAEVVDTGSDGHFKVTTEGTERIRVGPAGQIGVAGANYGASGQVLTSGGASGAVSWVDASGVVVVDGGNFATGGSAVSTSSTIDGGSFD
jgi:hypothetical protein